MSDRHEHQLYINDVARRAEEKLAARLTTPAQPDPPTPIDDENVRVIPQADGNVRIWLPAVEKLDTIGGYSAEIVIDDEATRQLLAALDTWLLKQQWPAEGCNTSMACVMRNGCPSCKPAGGRP